MHRFARAARRPAVFALFLLGLAALPAPVAAVVIDTFETGGFSHTLTAPITLYLTQQPDPAHCIASERTVILDYDQSVTGTLHSELVPLQGQDDAIEVSFPSNPNFSSLGLRYEGGPWDLTEGGQHSRVVVSVAEAIPGSVLSLDLRSGVQTYNKSASVSGPGPYAFRFSDFTGVDPTSVTTITLRWYGVVGGSGSIREIRTSTLAGSAFWKVWEPRTFTVFCAAAQGAVGQAGTRSAGEMEPAGEQRLGWDWTLDWPSAPTMAGPTFELNHLSAPGCVNVRFDASPDDSEGPGLMGFVAVNWLAPTFSSASFEFRITTDPAAPYTAQLVDSPLMTQYAQSFIVTYDVAISGAQGIPSGVMRQETIVSVHPDQGATFNFVELAPESGNGEGHMCQFVLSGGPYNPASPLFEVFTTASYMDDAGATSAAIPASESAPVAIAAHPGVTRGDVRFVLPAGSSEGAAVQIFDVMGRLVRTLPSAAGEARWDGKSADGVRAPTGVYFGRSAEAGEAARVVLLR